MFTSLLRNRVNQLVTVSRNPKVTNICESVMSYSMPDSAKSQMLIEHLGEIELDSVNDFIVREHAILNLTDFGIMDSIDKIKESSVYKSHMPLKYTVESFYNAKTIDNIPDYKLYEQFIAKFNNFKYDSLVKSCVDYVTEKSEELKEQLYLVNTLDKLSNGREAVILESALNSISNYLYQGSEANRSHLIEKLSNHSYNSDIMNLVNILKQYESTGLSEKFNLTNNNKTCSIKSMYSPVMTDGSNQIFYINNKYYQKSDSELNEVEESYVNQLSKDFVKTCNIFNKSNVKVESDSVCIYDNKNKYLITESDGDKKFYVNESLIESANPVDYLIKGGIIKIYDNTLLETIKVLWDAYDTICEIDYGKSISLNENSQYGVDIFKLDGKIYATRHNPSMNENKFFGEVNYVKLQNMVKSYLNFDIVEELDGSKQELAEIQNEKKAIMENMGKIQSEIFRVEQKLESNPRLVENQSVSVLIESLQNEIQNLEHNYSILESKENDINEGFTVSNSDNFLAEAKNNVEEYHRNGYTIKVSKHGLATIDFDGNHYSLYTNVPNTIKLAELGWDGSDTIRANNRIYLITSRIYNMDDEIEYLLKSYDRIFNDSMKNIVDDSTSASYLSDDENEYMDKGYSKISESYDIRNTIDDSTTASYLSNGNNHAMNNLYSSSDTDIRDYTDSNNSYIYYYEFKEGEGYVYDIDGLPFYIIDKDTVATLKLNNEVTDFNDINDIEEYLISINIIKSYDEVYPMSDFDDYTRLYVEVEPDEYDLLAHSLVDLPIKTYKENGTLLNFGEFIMYDDDKFNIGFYLNNDTNINSIKNYIKNELKLSSPKFTNRLVEGISRMETEVLSTANPALQQAVKGKTIYYDPTEIAAAKPTDNVKIYYMENDKEYTYTVKKQDLSIGLTESKKK